MVSARGRAAANRSASRMTMEEDVFEARQASLRTRYETLCAARESASANPKLFELIEERAVAYLKHTCRMGAVALCLLERTTNERLFDDAVARLIERSLRRAQAPRCPPA